MAERLAAAFVRAGVMPPPDLELKMRAVDIALRRFAMNKELWHDDSVEARTTLQSHLAFTLFVPAGRADKARIAVDRLREAGVLPATAATSERDASFDVVTHTATLVRFPKQKARRLALALTQWDSIIVPSIRRILEERSFDIRHEIVKQTIVGYGDKAAAHFMRNTGIVGGMDAVPIIDVHIKKLLTGLGLVTGNPNYGVWADQFRHCSRMLGIPPLLLDAVTWQTYAQNWDLEHSDFDNFEIKTENTEQHEHDRTSNSTDPERARGQRPDEAGNDPRDFVVRGIRYDSAPAAGIAVGDGIGARG